MKLNIALVVGAIVLAVLTLSFHLPVFMLLVSFVLLLVGLVRAAASDKTGDFKGQAYDRNHQRHGSGR